MIRGRAIIGELIMSKHARANGRQAQSSTLDARVDAIPLRPSGGPEAPNARDEVVPAVRVAEASGPLLDREQVANRAYGLWEARGKPDGMDREDWFEAERQLRADLD
jgi:hypothetical protein